MDPPRHPQRIETRRNILTNRLNRAAFDALSLAFTLVEIIAEEEGRPTVDVICDIMAQAKQTLEMPAQ